MAKRRRYPDETKAAVKAALLEGQGVTHVAEQYNIPKSTVANWKAEAVAGADVPNEKKEAIGDLLIDYLTELLATVRAQAVRFRDPEWLAEQDAADAAVLHGVLVDKGVRLMEAMGGRNADDTT